MTVPLSVVVFVSVCVCWSSTIAQKEVKQDLTCKDKVKGIWSCKLITDCPAAMELLKGGGRPEICGFKGTVPMTCCEAPAPPRSKKSKEMCNKYADSVFIRLQDELSGELTNYDTCTVNKQSTTRTKRVVGGIESTSRQYPHMTLIGYKKNNETPTKWLCGGSLISDRYVLTSATCSTSSANVVRLGDLNIVSDTDEQMSVAQPSEFEIIEKIVHPQYKNSSFYNDIALMKLNTSVYFTEFIRPICLNTDHDVSGEAFVTGWGSTSFGGGGAETLQTAKLNILSFASCNEALKSILDNKPSKLKDGISDSTMVCAQSTSGEADTCQGDAGGPLQVPLKEPYCMYSVVGITSFGFRCGDNKPGVYTRVSHFVPWIESIVWPTT